MECKKSSINTLNVQLDSNIPQNAEQFLNLHFLYMINCIQLALLALRCILDSRVRSQHVIVHRLFF